ncbi:hypothetical protein ACH4E7_30490 [Kitasatospora sp. NPDC018058]|uniref:hypothetical protein n=1 Tax=Kitasatospora sp. NPDC018058 TaxID=3364025 RepID=UPI0037BF6145
MPAFRPRPGPTELGVPVFNERVAAQPGGQPDQWRGQGPGEGSGQRGQADVRDVGEPAGMKLAQPAEAERERATGGQGDCARVDEILMLTPRITTRS